MEIQTYEQREEEAVMFVVVVYLNEEQTTLRYMVTRSVTVRRKDYAHVQRERGRSKLGRKQSYDAFELRFERI